jgi:hypothetical protein
MGDFWAIFADFWAIFGVITLEVFAISNIRNISFYREKTILFWWTNMGLQYNKYGF